MTERHACCPVDSFLRVIHESILYRPAISLAHLFPHVRQSTGHTYRQGNPDRSHQRVGHFVVIIKVHVKAIVKHTQIKTDILINRFLPFQIGITETVYQQSCSEIIQQPVIKLVSCYRVVRTEILVTGITD